MNKTTFAYREKINQLTQYMFLSLTLKINTNINHSIKLKLDYE